MNSVDLNMVSVAVVLFICSTFLTLSSWWVRMPHEETCSNPPRPQCMSLWLWMYLLPLPNRQHIKCLINDHNVNCLGIFGVTITIMQLIINVSKELNTNSLSHFLPGWVLKVISSLNSTVLGFVFNFVFIWCTSVNVYMKCLTLPLWVVLFRNAR